MALRAWVITVMGIFVMYLVFSFVGQLLGFFFGLNDYLANVLSAYGLYDQEWNSTMTGLKNNFNALWVYLPAIVFGAMIVYLLLESSRRRAEEVYW